jgi:hypothetical protein
VIEPFTVEASTSDVAPSIWMPPFTELLTSFTPSGRRTVNSTETSLRRFHELPRVR